MLPCSLLVAKLMRDLARGLNPFPRRAGLDSPRAIVANPLGTAVLVVLSVWVLAGILTNAWDVVRSRDDSPQQLAALVTRAVPPGAIVETSDWEIGFLADGVFHRPPVSFVVAATRVVFLNGTDSRAHEYQVPAAASFLVDGPFSKLTQAYASELARGEFRLVTSIGEYDLYRRA
jgi:hypothetical protein